MPTELTDFTIERQRHRRFVGREDVLGQLDEWLLGPGEAGWVVVTGGPGMGKSAVLSAWLARREAVGAVVPHHFVRRQVVDWDQPERIAASLAVQIEAIFPELRDPEAKPEGRLIELLGRVSKRLGASGDLVVMVDGLDETRAEAGDNPLPRFLPHVAPEGIRLLCATRPTYPHLSWIEARSPARRIDLDDRRWAASNEAVVRGFWETAATEYKPPLPIETRAAAIERAEGNVLHAVMLHDALRGFPAPERRADRIPRGLRELIGDIWSRAASGVSVRAGLGLLCAAQEALSLDVLAELAGWSYEERERFVPSARQLLLEEPTSWAGAAAYRPRHEWVRELMTERLGLATIRAHHGVLARGLATWPAPTEVVARQYALRHALIHRVDAGEWADAWRVAADMGFVETKCREIGAHEAEVDIARAAERCRMNGDETLHRQFDDLARALGRESHWLRAAPEATAALVWNRLRQSGWSADQIEQQLRLPAGSKFLRLRHLATRESPALMRELVGHTFSVTGCAVTPDGRRVISASADYTLKMWDLESGRALTTLEDHADRVIACAVTPDGQRVVSASADHTLKVWDLESGRALATLEGHASMVTACAVTPDGRRVVSASWDKTLKVWDLESGRALATLEGHADRVTACGVIPDGRRVVSASWDKTLKVWDLESGRTQATLEGHANWVTGCAVTPDGRCVVSASWDKTLKVWDLESGRAVATLEGHADRVSACGVIPDGRRAVSASWDKTLKVWDLESGRTQATLEGHAARVTRCAVTPDDWRGVSASRDKTLKVWDLESGRALATLEGHTARVTGCAVTPDGQRVVSGSDDKTLKVWDLESGRAVSTLEGHASMVTACAVTPDGRRVVSGSNDKTLKVWDLESGRVLATLEGHAARVTGCAVISDGRRGVSASADHTLKVWDLESGRVLATLEGHASGVNGCAVTPDGRRVISASADHTLKVWDLESGRVLATLEGHASYVNGCAVTPDGRRVVSASWDKTLKVWDLEAGACLLTHRANTAYTAIITTTIAIIAGDSAGSVWFLDWPLPDDQRTPSPDNEPPSPRPPMKKHTSPFMAAAPAQVDIGILTIRDDELRAVLAAFPDKAGILKGKTREYTLRHADAGHGERYTVAVLRQVEQGNGEAQEAARDLIDDLAPKLVLVVGIAGALPSDDVKLGDVVLSTRIHDFTVEARKAGQPPAYAASGGAIAKALAAAVANLAAREDDLGTWTDGLPAQPSVNWTRKGQLYGPQKWQGELRAKLEHHYPKRTAPRGPVYVAGTIASSDRLVKDPKLLFPWISTARDILAVEMESGGVYRAARERCPMLAIRSISDIVGLKRSDAWTKFACASAAAFTRAYLRTRPVPVSASASVAADPQ